MHESELVVAVVMGFMLAAQVLYSHWKIRRIKKRTLSALLNDEKYEWRTLQVLQAAIADDRRSTEELLLEIGARRSLDGQDLWTMKS